MEGTLAAALPVMHDRCAVGGSVHPLLFFNGAGREGESYARRGKMSYEVLEKQIRALLEEALEDVSIYPNKISLIYQSKSSIDFSFVDNIFGTLSDSEADEMRSCCGLKFRARSQ